MGYAVGLAGPAALTFALTHLRDDIDMSSVLLLFLLAVLAAAAVGGLGPTLAAAVAGFLLVNWFFTPPLHTWEIEHGENVLALSVFLLVGSTVSWYVATVGRRSAEMARAQAEAEALARLATALSGEAAGPTLDQVDASATSLAAVSHDLRTPLASIKASVTGLLSEDVAWPPDAVRQFCTTIDEETDRLTALVVNLLDMSRLTTGSVRPRRVEVGLDELVLAAVTSLGDRPAASRSSIDGGRGPSDHRTDPNLVERAMANLVDNALAWSPATRSVRVEAGVSGDVAQLRMVDHGPGIRPRPSGSGCSSRSSAWATAPTAPGWAWGWPSPEASWRPWVERSTSRTHPVVAPPWWSCSPCGGWGPLSRVLVVDDEPQILRALAPTCAHGATRSTRRHG